MHWSAGLYDGKAINMRTCEEWRETTMKRRTWSIDAFKDGECVVSQMGAMRNGQREIDG